MTSLPNAYLFSTSPQPALNRNGSMVAVRDCWRRTLVNPIDRIKTEVRKDLTGSTCALVIGIATFANLAFLVYVTLGGIG